MTLENIVKGKKKVNLINHNSDIIKNFNKFYSDGQIKEIRIEELPKEVINYFEAQSREFIDPKNYQEKNFEKTFVIHHNNYNKTYVTIQTKTYPANGDIEKLAYLMDTNEEDEPVGHGEIRFNISSKEKYFINKPFVGYTKTSERNEKKGLGIRRLYIMNELCQTLYGYPLNSDTVISEKAKRLWEKLIKEDKAKAYKEGKNDRYVFF